MFIKHTLFLIDNTQGCGILFVHPSTVKTGSPALIEFYPSDQIKKSHVYIYDYDIVRNNVTFNFSGERHERYELIEASEMRHVLQMKSVTPEDAGDYRVDCRSYLGTTDIASLRVAGLRLCCLIIYRSLHS